MNVGLGSSFVPKFTSIRSLTVACPPSSNWGGADCSSCLGVSSGGSSAAISSSHDDPSSVEIEYTAADCLYPTLSSSYRLSMISTPEGSLVLKESPASCL